MPCHTRMKTIFLRGLLWLYLLELGFMLVSTEPGYLDFDNLPDTNFSCAWRIVGGYYADVEAACQMFHVCTLGQNNETMDIRFLCLNGTVFDQSTRVCERIDEVDCEKSEQYYDNNRELYGNSAPLIIPGDPEATSPPSTTTTTTTTTTTFRPQYYTTSTRHVNRPHYYTTTASTTPPPVHKLSLHHHQFSSNSAPDFRFNPKEINLKLNPDSSPDIKPVSYQQQRFNDDKNQHVIVTTHAYKEDQKKKPVEYEFDYQDDKNYQNYQTTGEEEDYEDYKSTQYQTTPRKVILRPETSTYKNPSTSPTSQSYHFQRSDRPPINPPLIYSSLSSPAPFTHPSHSGNKRHSDPKIKKSISVSISDQNGKELAKLNNTPISQIFDSYLDYSEEDVTLLPLFEDVPKLQPSQRQKRNSEKKGEDLSQLMTDREAADVLRFLLSWYTNYEKTTKSVTIPLNPETITEINDELSPKSNVTNFEVTKNTTEKSKEVTENLVANASQNKPNFEEYLDEDYQNFLDSQHNKTKEQTNATAPIEYDYYYEEIDENLNETNQNMPEVSPVQPYDILQEKKDIEEQEIPKADAAVNEINKTKSEDGSTTVKEPEKEENNDVNSEDNNPLYDYIDDNYEGKAYNKEKNDRGNLKVADVKDVLNEYVDDNYEVKSYKNSLDQQDTIDKKADEDNHKDIEDLKENQTNSKEVSLDQEHTTDMEDDQKNNKDKEDLKDIQPNYKEVEDIPKIEKEYPELNDTEVHKEEISEVDKNLQNINEDDQNLTTHEDSEVTTNAVLTTITEAPVEDIATTTEYIAVETDDKHLETTTLLDETTTQTYTTQITTEEPTTTTETYTEELLLTTTEVPETTTETIVTMETTTPQITEETVEDNSEAPTTPTVVKEEIMNDNLEGMIEVIEKNTKSIATTIVMPSKNLGLSMIYPKAEEVTEEHTAPIFTTTSEVLTTITTPKLPETTRFATRRRGNHRFSVDANRGRTRNYNQVLRSRTTTEKIKTSSEKIVTSSEKLVTVSSLLKSANPTLARNSFTSTTPLSRHVRVKLRKERINKKYIFTCIDKKVNNFYSDPRDCRLFHYCSPGYTSTQVVDMKFVCDLGTYYDEEGLICTKDRPKRCL